MDVEVGQLWKAKYDIYSSGEHCEINGRPSKVLIKKDEIVEVRYPYRWHLRTVDDVYFHLKEGVLLENFELFGVIHSDIIFSNKHKLKAILEINYYYSMYELYENLVNQSKNKS